MTDAPEVPKAVWASQIAMNLAYVVAVGVLVVVILPPARDWIRQQYREAEYRVLLWHYLRNHEEIPGWVRDLRSRPSWTLPTED